MRCSGPPRWHGLQGHRRSGTRLRSEGRRAQRHKCCSKHSGLHHQSTNAQSTAAARTCSAAVAAAQHAFEPKHMLGGQANQRRAHRSDSTLQPPVRGPKGGEQWVGIAATAASRQWQCLLWAEANPHAGWWTRAATPRPWWHAIPRRHAACPRTAHTSNDRSNAKMVDRCSSGTSSANRAELLHPHQLQRGMEWGVQRLRCSPRISNSARHHSMHGVKQARRPTLM